jgi:hypothetical protein
MVPMSPAFLQSASVFSAASRPAKAGMVKASTRATAPLYDPFVLGSNPTLSDLARWFPTPSWRLCAVTHTSTHTVLWRVRSAVHRRSGWGRYALPPVLSDPSGQA